MDSIVDTYLAIDTELQDDLDNIEEAVFAGHKHVDSQTIYRLKREVLEFRRAAVPLAAPLRMLHDGSRSPVSSKEVRLLLRDVADHLLVIDHVETYDRLLTDVLNAHLAQISVQQNNDMRKISAWVAIAAVPTMVAGIYGMNFEEVCPSCNERTARRRRAALRLHFVVLAAMAAACVSLYRGFPQVGLALTRLVGLPPRRLRSR